jgi:hypothetical protein
MIDLKDRMLIITSNIIALFIAYYYHSISFILLFYWIENGIVGVFNIFRMISCGKNHVAKFFYVPFFIVHYGIFMIIHFFFLIMLIGWIGEYNVLTFTGISTIIIGIVALLVTHGMRFIVDETSGELRSKGPENYIMKPYPGIIVMHLTIILGAFIYSGLGKPFYIVMLIIVLKTFAELSVDSIKWNSTVRQI